MNANRQVSPYHYVRILPHNILTTGYSPSPFLSPVSQKYLTDVKAEFQAYFLEINPSEF